MIAMYYVNLSNDQPTLVNNPWDDEFDNSYVLNCSESVALIIIQL